MNENQLIIAEPDLCQHCGWEPMRRNNENQEINVENKWFIIPIPNSVVWLFVCPACHCVMANKNCVGNVKELIKRKSSKIITSKSDIVKPKLSVLPNKNVFTRN